MLALTFTTDRLSSSCRFVGEEALGSLEAQLCVRPPTPSNRAGLDSLNTVLAALGLPLSAWPDQSLDAVDNLLIFEQLLSLIADTGWHGAALEGPGLQSASGAEPSALESEYRMRSVLGGAGSEVPARPTCQSDLDSSIPVETVWRCLETVCTRRAELCNTSPAMLSTQLQQIVERNRNVSAGPSFLAPPAS